MTSPPTLGRDRPDSLLGFAGVAAAVALAPILVPAGVLAVVLDRRGARRWPSAAAGVATASLVAGAGGLPAAAGLLANLVAGRARAPLGGWVALVALWAASVAVLGPVLAVAALHADESEATRRARALSRLRRARARARRRSRARRWPAPAHRAVLGVAVDAAALDGRPVARPGAVVSVELETLHHQALVVGETGSGKTVTALTIAGEALRAGWSVYWVDGKADGSLAARFVATAAAHGVSARDGAREPIDGWRGGADSIVSRLLATQRFTEPYYAGIARNVLRWAMAPCPPRSFAELLARIDKRVLRRAWRGDPDEAEKIRQLPDAEFLGARYRYEGVAWAVGTALDGSWSYEDTAAAYVPVGRPEQRHQAEEIGAFLLEDLLHWAMARKPAGTSALVVVDEFSKLAARPDAAVDLVERVRSFGVGVVLVGQTWASLGPSETVRERLAGTVGTLLVHRLKQPERLVALAGTAWALERTEQTAGLALTGRATQRPARHFLAGPDEVRALERGEAFLVTPARAVLVAVRAPPDGGGAGQRPGRPVGAPFSARRTAGSFGAHDDPPSGGATMPMREDCRHFESRTYDNGEVARYCVLGLAPEQPWRCPEHCDRYESSLIAGGFATGPLERPPVEEEPLEESPEAIADVLDDAEMIVEAAERDVERDLDRGLDRGTDRRWWQFWKRRPPDDGSFHLSNR